MRPRSRRRIRASAARVPYAYPRYVTSVTLRYSSGSISQNGANTEVIALLIHMSMGPRSRSTRWAASSTAVASAISTEIARVAAGPSLASSFSAAASRSSSRASNATRSPRAANACAIARPTPADPPVTTTTLTAGSYPSWGVANIVSGYSATVREHWYRQALIYSLDVDTFQDSNGDGVGDLPGLISRLEYLSRLGVTTLWLNPIHPSPRRDDGYDVTDYYAVHPQIGSLGDFVDLVNEAASHGIRVMIDLVVNHTSNEHPWFQSARSDPKSPYRDWYVWSDERPGDIRQGVVFPGEQKETWTFDEEADAWYYHRFFDFQPDLNM